MLRSLTLHLHNRLLLPVLLTFLLLPGFGWAQYSISGTTCPGSTAWTPYSVAGGPFSTADRWFISGGTVSDANGTSTNSLPCDASGTVNVLWSNTLTSGTLTFYHPGGTPVASITVAIMSGGGLNAYTISGSSCVMPATSSGTYTISGGSWSTADHWCVTGGTINGPGTACANNTGSPTIGVTWGTGVTSGTVAYYHSSCTTPTVLTVAIQPPGTLSPAGAIFVPSGLSTAVSITGTVAVQPPFCSIAGNFVYNWQSSTDGVNWSAIGGNTQNFSTTAVFTTSTQIRRGISVPSTPGIAYTIPVSIVPEPPFTPGTVSPAAEYAVTGINAGTLTATAAGNGAFGPSYFYQWQSSTDNINWTNISGASGNADLTYSPGVLSTNMYYRQAVNNGPLTMYTNSVAVTLVPPLVVGAISPASQTIAYNTVPAAMTVSGNSGGSGSYTYQWQSSTDGVHYSNAPSISAILSPANLQVTTWYQVLVTSANMTLPTAAVIVTVMPQLNGGSIGCPSPITYGSAVTINNLQSPSGGNCSGSYNYQWMQSIDGVNYQPINGAISATYTTGNLFATTWFERWVNCGTETAAPVFVLQVNPKLVPGDLVPGAVTVGPGSDPGLLTANPASGGGCGGQYTYHWQQSPDGVNFSNITAATSQNYDPGNVTVTTWYRRMVTCGTDNGFTNSATVSVGALPAGPDLNFIRERDLSRPGITDTVTADGLTNPVDVQQTISYFDGLGRPMQTVAKQASPLLHDMVTLQVYDPYGREITKYLPYTSPSNDGLYKVNGLSEQNAFNTAQFPGEQFYYGQSDFEPSPINRPLANYSPGVSWTGAGRGISSQYQINAAQDSVLVWTISMTPGSIPVMSGFYNPNTLYKNSSIDEQGHQEVEYKDIDGHVVLKKVQLSAFPGTAHVGWLCTYYVYDDMDNLRFVIPPRALELVNGVYSISQGIADELCFRYEFDLRKRLFIKKLPGAGEEWMVYDLRDRQVMSQDQNLRTLGKWMISEYDSLNRPWRTGLLTDANNQSYHQNLASASIAYPNVSANYEVLRQTFYDDYSQVSAAAPALGSSLATTYTGNGSYFINIYDISPAYADPMTSSIATRGMTTGTMSKVVGSSPAQYLYSVSFYDDRGRAIQTQMINYTGGVDTITTQYDFCGKPLRTLMNHQKNLHGPQHHNVLTKLSYDNDLRLKSVYKNLDGAPADQLIDSIQYNEQGQLRAKYLGNLVDSLIYDYNIRGWVTGINKSYVAPGATNHYFGMELGFDKTASIAATTSYTNPEFNANIAGTVWKSAGDGVARKYDFAYDVANRLTGAAFLQNSSGSAWDHAKIDFTVSNLGYDANGNILTMNQNGYKLGGSSPIDQLSYTYLNNDASNKLMQVTDAANDNTTKLGDFHYNPATKGATDYSYDGNGNLVLDNNKAIDSMVYNFLNLPVKIHMNGKGNIFYTYDAVGEKLQKLTIDSASRHSTTTLYLGSFVYQQTDTISNPGGGIDSLQLMGHDEGRARWAYHKYLNGTTAYGWEYDFFEKDHLGDTRMVLSQEKDTARYMATMEAAYRTTENALFYNIPATSYPRASAPGYPVDLTTTNPNDSVIRVNGSGQKAGPAIILKVMSGDKVDIGVNYYYNNVGAANGQSLSAADIINALASGIVSASGVSHGSFSDLTGSSSPLNASLNNFISSNNATVQGKPNAYLNWILLDDQFNYVATSGQSGALQVGNAGTAGGVLQPPLAQTGIPITKSGYLYVYVSNATPNWDVFFDNLSVRTYSGPMLEEYHYYPFGLMMAGISDKALKSNYAVNKRLFNGNELQNTEFADGSGLELYDFNARTYDQQTGRFLQEDPEIENDQESLTPYQFGSDDPVRYNDPTGKCPWCIGFIVGAVTDYATQVAGNLMEGKSLGKSLTDVNKTQILISGVAGALSGGLSALTPKTQIAKGLVQGGKILVDVVESGAKQLNSNGKISLKQTAFDVAASHVAGKLTENVKVNSSSTLKTAEKQLGRAERIASKDATSSGRTATVNKLQNKLATEKAANQVASDGSSRLISGTAGEIKEKFGGNGSWQPPSAVTVPKTDATYVKPPIIANVVVH